MIRLFKLVALLPLWLLRGIGLSLGWSIYLFSSRYRRMMRENWQQALVSGRLGVSGAKAKAVLRSAIGHAGLIATELPKIWCDPNSAVRMRITGMEAVKQHAASGKGVIMLTPHLGAFELSSRAFSLHLPITVLYRPAKQAALRRLMETLRPMPTMATAPANAAGVRQLLRALKKGQAIGMLPDQVPTAGDGIYADFFGRSAYTMTLPLRLAQASGAAVFWALAVRTDSGWHLDLTYWEDSARLSEIPIEQAVARMNHALEAQIARAPEQYLWAYNRYKRPSQSQLQQGDNPRS